MIITYFYLLIWLLAAFVFSRNGNLQCSADHTKWLYVTNGANYFATCHLVIVILQAIMVERAFYSFPRKSGFFDENEEGDSSCLTN